MKRQQELGRFFLQEKGKHSFMTSRPFICFSFALTLNLLCRQATEISKSSVLGLIRLHPQVMSVVLIFCRMPQEVMTTMKDVSQSLDSLLGAKSRITHLQKIGPIFSSLSFVITILVYFYFGLLLLPTSRCFSTLGSYYFKVSFNFKAIL